MLSFYEPLEINARKCKLKSKQKRLLEILGADWRVILKCVQKRKTMKICRLNVIGSGRLCVL
jgi:hypothetical protein